MDKRKSIIRAAIILAGLVVGWYHLRLALKAIFVFKNNEPLASWICIISGPISTLPATVVGMFKRKIGAYWLIGGALISAIAFLLLSPVDVLEFGWRIPLPMLVLGCLFLLLNRKEKETQIKSNERPQNNAFNPDAE